DLLAAGAGLTPARTRAALTQLGTSGRVGFDLAEAAHFHRELPYDARRVAAMNPRLRAARALVEEGAVRFGSPEVAHVTTGETRVVRFDGDRVTCTCPWWLDHRGGRGPCKHVLAARIAREPAEDTAEDTADETAGPSPRATTGGQA
ncbi:SWIM zinc finger family protein, partial [Spirillospora sp. NPDC049652]